MGKRRSQRITEDRLRQMASELGLEIEKARSHYRIVGADKWSRSYNLYAALWRRLQRRDTNA